MSVRTAGYGLTLDSVFPNCLSFDDGVSGLWTRLRCSRCRYSREHPGPVTVADLDGECALCRAPLGAVTAYRVGLPLDACRYAAPAVADPPRVSCAFSFALRR